MRSFRSGSPHGLLLRQAGMKANIHEFPSITVNVRVSGEGDAHTFTTIVTVAPQGKSARPAQLDEVEVRLMDMVGFFEEPWRTIEQTTTGASGLFGVGYIRREPKLDPGHYRIACRHVASNAEYGKEFDVFSNLLVGNWSANLMIKEGNEMPADFQQERGSMNQPASLPPGGIPRIDWNPTLKKFEVR